MEHKRKLRRRYYTVNIPQDCESETEKRFDLAYLSCMDNPKIPYIIPAQWHMVWDEGDYIRICRTSRI
jgi:hypothetical protein